MPRDFEVCLAEIEEADSQGSARPSFVYAARTLARQIYHEYPHGLAYDEWKAEMNQLQEMVKAGNGRGIMRWFDHYYPDCMENVPREKREAFVRGSSAGAGGYVQLGMTRRRCQPVALLPFLHMG